MEADRRKLSWRNLTEEEKEAARRAGVVNGCGGKGSFVPVPEYRFSASCDFHDFSYWVGGTRIRRKMCDLGFLEALLSDADTEPQFWRRLWLKGAARRYYRAVRLLGWRYWNKDGPATWEDFERQT